MLLTFAWRYHPRQKLLTAVIGFCFSRREYISSITLYFTIVISPTRQESIVWVRHRTTIYKGPFVQPKYKRSTTKYFGRQIVFFYISRINSKFNTILYNFIIFSAYQKTHFVQKTRKHQLFHFRKCLHMYKTVFLTFLLQSRT